MKTSENINEIQDRGFIGSETIGKIAEALAKAQGAMGHAAKDSTNPHYKSRYADLTSVIEASREHLVANGLTVMQPATATGNLVTVTTLLAHSSGEWISSSLTLQAKDAGPQSVGSALTYGRRYGYSSLIGVGADDDDGEGAEGRQDTNAGYRPQQRPPAHATTNGNGQSEQFGKFTEWIKDNIPDLFTDRNDAWARVKLAASQQKHNESTLRSCTDPKVFDAIKSILSVTDPVAA